MNVEAVGQDLGTGSVQISVCSSGRIYPLCLHAGKKGFEQKGPNGSAEMQPWNPSAIVWWWFRFV